MKARRYVFLAIDDHQENLISLMALIHEAFANAEVLTALNGEDGLRIASRHEPDIILLDIMMPSMDGYEVCRRLKMDPVLTDIPVIFLTALKSDKHVRLKALECGGEAFIYKPIDEVELYVTIRGILKIRDFNLQNQIRIRDLRTDLHNKEDELRDSLMRFQLMIENISEVVAIIDTAGIVRYLGPNNKEVFGLRLEEVVGKSAFEFIHPDDRLKSLERFKALHASSDGYEQSDEFRYLRKDGACVWIQMTGKNMVNNELINGFLLTLKDISSRKESEQTIKAEAERFRILVESTQHMIWIVEPQEYRLTFFNTSYADFHRRYAKIEVHTGMTPDELGSQAQSEVWKGLYARAVQDGRFNINHLSKVYKKESILTLAVMKIEDRIIGISVFAEDITEEIQTKRELEVSKTKLEHRLQQFINTISKIGELRDVYTAGHQWKVRQLACAIASKMGLPSETIKNISFGALIHDIGKIYVASDILNKPGKISALEYQILQTHVIHGYEVTQELEFPSPVPTMIYQHHERLDGTGYPQGLMGDQILTESRILAVADVVEAMTSHRPYRPSLGQQAALDEINLHRGTKYDEVVVDTCNRLFLEEGFKFSYPQ